MCVCIYSYTCTFIHIYFCVYAMIRYLLFHNKYNYFGAALPLVLGYMYHEQIQPNFVTNNTHDKYFDRPDNNDVMKQMVYGSIQQRRIYTALRLVPHIWVRNVTPSVRLKTSSIPEPYITLNIPLQGTSYRLWHRLTLFKDLDDWIKNHMFMKFSNLTEVCP